MDANAIEQMNKVRESLGLAPLPMPNKAGEGPQFKQHESESDSEDSEDLSTLDKRQAAAGSNWQKLEDERREKLERQKRKDVAKKARDAAQRFAKLEGKGLGDEDDEDSLDTRTWLLQQKKRQKKIEKARKLEEELAAREKQAEYTSRDLAGVKVGHEVDDFDEFTGEQVLTLKDAEIGEESEDDELENADLKAKEKLEEKLRLKKKRPDYDPTEQNEPQAILSKYDEEIEGKKGKRFLLDGQAISGKSTRARQETEESDQTRGVKVSLDMFKDDIPMSDYVDPSTIKVKKPKKTKEKKTRRKEADDEDESLRQSDPAVSRHAASAMDVDDVHSVPTNTTTKKRAAEFDDDDLQAKLAEQRRDALKKRKKFDAAEIARQVREETSLEDDNPDDGGITIDETTEFVANLKKPELHSTKPTRDRGSRTASPEIKEEDHDGDVEMNGQSYAEIEDEEDRLARIKRESSAPADRTATGLEEEGSMIGHGIGASLAMLRKRGLVSSTSTEELSAKERERTRFLASKQHLIDDYDARAREQREADRRNGRYDKMTNRERDNFARQQNEAREHYISRLLADKFNKEYKPDVQLRYNDEFGREMNQKEAFKHLSHMFHGKGSGKQKTEKRLKKIEDEKKHMAKGILNIGDEGAMVDEEARDGRRQRTAGVRLQ